MGANYTNNLGEFFFVGYGCLLDAYVCCPRGLFMDSHILVFSPHDLELCPEGPNSFFGVGWDVAAAVFCWWACGRQMLDFRRRFFCLLWPCEVTPLSMSSDGPYLGLQEVGWSGSFLHNLVRWVLSGVGPQDGNSTVPSIPWH